ncbi:MAG: SRPBCC domain-containing protein [Mycobacteriaceae bacterium]|nr:SRPBCC domain-containing protein [Mycobacteriaceae bacterium]MBV9639660.1 SRPBCC domain-containing protein [Mycobacteriaceae bacterium]
MANFIATAEVDVGASATKVWTALTDPDIIRQYFFGAEVQTDWRPGSPIVWRGEYNGKPFEDKGEILDVEQNRLLRVTHFSPLSGQPDRPENYHTLTYELDEHGGSTHVVLSQDNNGSEAEAEGATANWRAMLHSLKKTVERS